nr:choice-of-anchor A family protein [Marinifaba aquimaris]
MLSCSSLAANIDLGVAGDYNAFVRGDFKVTSSDTEGRIAVGGDFIVDGGYDVGTKIKDFNMGDGPALVVGGNVEKTGNGFLNIYNTSTLPNPEYGDLVYGGSVNGSPIGVANQIQDPQYIDFDNAFAHLQNVSKTLSESTNAITDTKHDWNASQEDWKLDFKADPNQTNDDGVYVFDVTQDMFENQWGSKRTDWYVDTTDMQDPATLVFNIRGENGVVNFTQSNIFLNDANDPLSEYFRKGEANGKPPVQVIYNFYDASVINLDLNLQTDLYGTILAPTSNISANSSVIWGQVIANSWEGNMQINYNPFTPVITTPVPAPSAFWAFFVALGLVVAKNKFRFKATPNTNTVFA